MGGWTTGQSEDDLICPSGSRVTRLRLSAHGASACNAWKFRHFETKKDLIDELRADIHSGMTILKKYCGALGGRFTYLRRLWVLKLSSTTVSPWLLGYSRLLVNPFDSQSMTIDLDDGSRRSYLDQRRCG
jgi:hypothetical protein